MYPFSKMHTFALLGLSILLLMSSKFSSKITAAAFRIYPDLDFVTPLFQAHAHNDYEHPQPLLGALSHGFTSIEADIHLINNELYVNHLRPFFLNDEKTLTKLYLDPLFELFQRNGGQFFPTYDRPITLMIDIKSNKNKTYERLKTMLTRYEPMLTYWENNIEFPGAVTIILSGNRPIDKVLAERKRWVLLDGRIRDLGKNYPPEVMPMISDKFSRVCGWQIFSKRPSKEKLKKLNEIARQVHAEGKKFRLWKSPENELVWETMLNEGVDIINTDSLLMLSNFFQKRSLQDPIVKTVSTQNGSKK